MDDTVTGDNLYVGDNTLGIYAWGAQLEVGSFDSSYIPTTTAAVTRNADILTVPRGALLPNAAGSFSMEWNLGGWVWADVTLRPVILGIDGNLFWLAMAANGGIYYYDGTNIPIVKNVTAGTTYRSVMGWSGIVNKWSFDAGAVGSGAYDGSWTGDPVCIGSLSDGTRSIFGHVKNLRIWNRALSDAEMIAITS